jgi:hypothetical protein
MAWAYCTRILIANGGEYVPEALKRREIYLSELGADGWELVTSVPIDQNGTIGVLDTFKKLS